MNWAVIMAGGVGERFWPLSRRKQPKQLQAIVNPQRTMIGDTIARIQVEIPASRIVVVTNREQEEKVRAAVGGEVEVLAEPVGRNTAPCIAWATQHIEQRDPEAVIAVVPSDSYVKEVLRYGFVLKAAMDLARRRNVLITVGIRPTRAATGYGYIQIGDPIEHKFWRAKRFVEKPNVATASQFLDSGDYRWNAGMFVWSVSAIREAYQKHASSIWQGVKCDYANVEKISVDYAIMEKADNVVVADGEFDWDDVGDWTALERHWKKDDDGNVATAGGFVGVDTKNCVVFAGEQHVIATVGLRDLVIVHTPDATLVCRKEDVQRIRELVGKLAEHPRGKNLL